MVFTEKKIGEDKATAISVVEGRITAVSVLKDAVVILAGDKLYSYNTIKKDGLKEIYDFSKIKEEFEVFEMVTGYGTVTKKGEAYFFVSVKRYKEGKYSWKIYGNQIK